MKLPIFSKPSLPQGVSVSGDPVGCSPTPPGQASVPPPLVAVSLQGHCHDLFVPRLCLTGLFVRVLRVRVRACKHVCGIEMIHRDYGARGVPGVAPAKAREPRALHAYVQMCVPNAVRSAF